MTLEDILGKINKEFKKELAIKGIGELKIKRIPFTSPRLNYETYGGIPRGRISMFAGKESSGKTTTALDAVKNAQILFQQEWEDEIKECSTFIEENSSKKSYKAQVEEKKDRVKYLTQRGPLKVVYFDAEGTIDGQWAKKLGVDVENIWLVRLHTQTAEQFLDQVMRVVRDTDDVGLVIIDSIAVLVPQLTHGESFEQKAMGGNAKVVTDFCNEVCPVLGEKDIACIIINQARDDFKNPYADFSIPCGNGLKLASSLILTFQKGKLLDAAGNEQKQSFETPQGNVVWVRIQKTKICKPDRRVGFYTLSYDYGVDVVADLIPMAVDLGIIKKAGAWFSIINPDNGELLTYEDGEVIKFQGQVNLMTFLRETPEIFNFINNYVMAKITGTDILAVDAETDRQAIEDAQNDLAEVPLVRVEESSKIVDEIPFEEVSA
jgi:recombination protein RecA